MDKRGGAKEARVLFLGVSLARRSVDAQPGTSTPYCVQSSQRSRNVPTMTGESCVARNSHWASDDGAVSWSSPPPFPFSRSRATLLPTPAGGNYLPPTPPFLQSATPPDPTQPQVSANFSLPSVQSSLLCPRPRPSSKVQADTLD